MMPTAQESPVRLRVLLSAFAFSPVDGSEGGVGWETAMRLASHHDVTVLCGDVSGSRPAERALNNYFQDRPSIPGMSVHYIPPSRIVRILERLHHLPGLWPFYWVAYRHWQRQAYVAARNLHRVQHFDVVHQLTLASYRDPGYLSRLPIPFFWGPVGGAADVPAAFRKTLGAGGIWRFGLRNFGNWIQRLVSFRARRAARLAEVVWVGGDEERRVVERWGGRPEYLSQTGTTAIAGEPRTRSVSEPLRIVWSGLHIPGKALPLLLRAAAGLKEDVSVRLHILGDGPDMPACQAMAARLKLDGRVTWRGKLPRAEALNVMAGADVLVHTSLKEGTPTVVVEALALGLPIVCHDVSGMAVAVTEDCGIKIPLRDPETSVAGFRAAIEALAEDAPLYTRLSAGALARAQELSWARKVSRFSEAYCDSVVAPFQTVDEHCQNMKQRHTLPTPTLDKARIAFLMSFLWPQRLGMFEALQRAVGDLRIFVSTTMERNRPWQLACGKLAVVVQKTLTIPVHWRHPLGFRDINYLHFPLDTYSRLAHYRPSVVVSQQLGCRTLMATVFRFLHPHVRLIVWAQMTEHQQKGNRPIRLALRKLLLRFTDAVIANGHSAKRLICGIGYPEAKVFIAHTACDLGRFLAVTHDRRAKNSPRRFLYVGRLVEGKGLLPFLERLAAFAHRNPSEHVVFEAFGYGPIGDRLNTFEHPPNMVIHNRGAVTLEELPSAYASGDVFVFPTLSDEWGLVINEAMASGLPVLGSQYSQAVMELVDDGSTGWTFAPDHPEQVDDAIGRAMRASDEEIAEMGRRARQAVERVNPERIAADVLQAIRFVLGDAEAVGIRDGRGESVPA